jgi:hypothetical protein
MRSSIRLSPAAGLLRAMAAGLALFGLLSLPGAAQDPRPRGLYPDASSYENQLRARQRSYAASIAAQTYAPGEDGRKRIYLGVTKVHTGTDAATGMRYLREAIDDPQPWSSFETYAMMDALLRLGDRLPAEMAGAIRQRLERSFGADLGFTDNHRLQYRTARYLFAQTWPDGPPFADGGAPAAAGREAQAWITQWISDQVSRGMYEYDSPNYHHLYLLCLTTLHDFARDAAMRRQAWMMLHVLLVDWATEYLHGTWIGAHSREKYNQVTHTLLNSGAATPFGYLFFGDGEFRPDLPETFYTGLGAIQAFTPLAMVGRIATDRSSPYVLRELKAPRRGPLIVNGPPTWKYDYVTNEYALGSSWGDLTDVENHRWDLTWTSDRDGSLCFFLNPSYSARQLLRYFETTIDSVLPEILRQRPYYADPNKWIEGSPFEEVFQHENALAAVYDIPSGERNQHINGFFSKGIDERRVGADHWVFCRAGSIYFAVRTSEAGRWTEQPDHFRLTLAGPVAAVVLEVARASEYSSFDEFCRQVARNPVVFDRAAKRLRYRSSRGREIEVASSGERRLDGRPVNLDDWPLFEGPWVNAARGTRVITIEHGGERVVLDFNDLSVTHRAVGAGR